jgi:RHS repeat-associated protein
MDTISIGPDAPPCATPPPVILAANERLASGPQTTSTEINVWQTQTFTPILRWGHDYMHARYYSPNLGRFVSVDTVGGEVGNSQSWNRYSYTRNNPIKHVDVDGRSIWSKLWKVSKVARDKEKREIVVQSIKGRSKQKSIQRTSEALDTIDPNTSRRVVTGESGEARDAMAKQLSTDGKIRGPEKSPGHPEHVHPNEGPYTDVHVQSSDNLNGSAAAVAGTATAGDILGEIFAPNSQMMTNVPDATVGEVISAAVWDTANTVDPTGLTDLISWWAGLDD